MTITKEFKPTPKQLRAFDIAWNDPFVKNLLGFGPSRSGKSAGFMAMIINRALAYPGTQHAIFRLTLRSCHSHLMNGTFPEIMNMLNPGYIERKDVRFSKADNVFEFHNGSKMFFEGLDPTRIDKVLGAQYATAWVNECNEIDDYDIIQQLASRMADTGPLVRDGKPVVGADGKMVMSRPLMLFDCNPDLKGDWEYQCFVEKRHPLSGKPFSDTEKLKWRRVYMPATENAHNIAEGYLDDLAARYDGSPNMASRFLEGRWRDDNPNAMFRKDMFKFREIAKEQLVRIIVAVDPAGTSGNGSDLTGIVVVGLGWDGHAYVLEDASLKGTPQAWAAQVANMYDKWDADLVVAEKNYGGEMVEHTIRTHRRNIPVKMVNASRGKMLRAEPVQMLYLKGQVFHTDTFKELEAQMCDFKHDTKKSPDRLDALVWGLSELMKLSGQSSGTITVKRATGVWRA